MEDPWETQMETNRCTRCVQSPGAYFGLLSDLRSIKPGWKPELCAWGLLITHGSTRKATYIVLSYVLA